MQQTSSSTNTSHTQVAILWCNLGTPDAPTPAAVRRYLAEFLSDPRIVELPRLFWLPLLHGLVLRTRPKKSAAKYAAIWMPEGSPLNVWSERQAKLLQGWLAHKGHRVVVAHAMRYGNPSIPATIDRLCQQGIERILLLPAYPQYSSTTTASLNDKISAWNHNARQQPEWRFANHYEQDPLYIRALAQKVQKHWMENGRSQMLIMSFHGTPERRRQLGDPYADQCHTTARLLAQQLGLSDKQYRVTFQSRFGHAKWLEPATQGTLEHMARKGLERADLICPGFVSDCVETLEEIAIECREAFLAAGGQAFHYIPCLNDSPEWIDALGHISLQHLAGWLPAPTQLRPSYSTLLAPAARSVPAVPAHHSPTHPAGTELMRPSRHKHPTNRAHAEPVSAP